jgi:alpha-1,4-digalacturonate transport system permease protein
MDGTPPSRVFWRITLPLLGPNLAVVLVLALIRAVQIFDEVYVLTGGGPGTLHALPDAVHLRGRASRLSCGTPASPPRPPCSWAAVLVVLTLAAAR